MTDTEFDRLMDAHTRGDAVSIDSPSTSAELDTRRSKSGLGQAVLGGAEEVIGWDEANQGPIMGHGPAVASPHPDVALGPNDVVFGDADEGVIASGPHVEAPTVVAHPAPHDMVFAGDDQGGYPADLSGYAGQSNVVLNPAEPTATLHTDVTALRDDAQNQ